MKSHPLFGDHDESGFISLGNPEYNAELSLQRLFQPFRRNRTESRVGRARRAASNGENVPSNILTYGL